MAHIANVYIIFLPNFYHIVDRLLSGDSILCDNSKQRVSIFKNPLFKERFSKTFKDIRCNSVIQHIGAKKEDQTF